MSNRDATTAKLLIDLTEENARTRPCDCRRSFAPAERSRLPQKRSARFVRARGSPLNGWRKVVSARTNHGSRVTCAALATSEHLRRYAPTRGTNIECWKTGGASSSHHRKITSWLRVRDVLNVFARERWRLGTGRWFTLIEFGNVVRRPFNVGLSAGVLLLSPKGDPSSKSSQAYILMRRASPDVR